MAGKVAKRYSVKVAFSGVFGALALVLSLAKVSIPFPLMPFLKVDFAEIVDLLAYLLGGAFVGFLTATVHFLGLMAYGEWVPIGPLMKYAAVLSTLFGFVVVKYPFRNPHRVAGLVALAISCITRVAVMVPLNILVVAFLFPPFLDIIASVLRGLGLVVRSTGEVLFYYSAIVALYNVVQLLLVFLVAVLIYRRLKRALPSLTP